MRVGIPRESMEGEHRVALGPAGVRELVSSGHEVLVERGAGRDSGFRDELYERAGAKLVDDPGEAWGAQLVCKVKEPLTEEFGHLREDLVLFTFLHLAAHPELTSELASSGTLAIGYETVQLTDGRLPLLAPMSEIAGRMAPHVGAHYLESEHGAGVLLGGVPGSRPGRVVVLGAGMAGRNAAFIAAGMEAEVFLLDKNMDRLREVDVVTRGRIMTLYSTREAVEGCVKEADLVVGAVLVPGARAPVVVPSSLVGEMQPGRVVVDISVDQGGCIETSEVTTHHDPVFERHEVIHYCVGNMPGAVPHTSTNALTNVTLPYVESIADLGVPEALRADPALARGVNLYGGHVTNEGVANAHGMPYTPLERLLD